MRPNRSMPSSTVIPELAYPDIGEAIAWLSYAARARRGRHTVATESGHWIPLDRRDVVLAAIKDVVAAL